MKDTFRPRTLSTLFVGVDAGGTRTRALVSTGDGRIVGRGLGPGANLWSGDATASEAVATALADAFDGMPAGSVEGGIVAVAGPASARPDLVAEITGAWTRVGLRGAPHVVPDILAAYRAGTTAPDGVVLVAGTGSVAAAIADHRIHMRAGGHGWLVGDEGSAVWLGLAGVRAALRAADRRGPETTLLGRVCDALAIDPSTGERTSSKIVAAVHGRPPAALGRIALEVTDAADNGDPVAQEIVAAAVDELVDMASAVVEEPPPVVVLAGSVIVLSPPINRRVVDRLRATWPATTIVETVSGAVGAVAMAIEEDRGAPITDELLGRLRAQLAAPDGHRP